MLWETRRRWTTGQKNLSSLSVAHVKVEADATKPFPIVLELVRQSGATFRVEVEYPWLPPTCAHCNEIGHNQKDSLKIKRVWVPIDKGNGTTETSPNTDAVIVTIHEPGAEAEPPLVAADSSVEPLSPASIDPPSPVIAAMEIDKTPSPLPFLLNLPPVYPLSTPLFYYPLLYPLQCHPLPLKPRLLPPNPLRSFPLLLPLPPPQPIPPLWYHLSTPKTMC